MGVCSSRNQTTNSVGKKLTNEKKGSHHLLIDTRSEGSGGLTRGGENDVSKPSAPIPAQSNGWTKDDKASRHSRNDDAVEAFVDDGRDSQGGPGSARSYGRKSPVELVKNGHPMGMSPSTIVSPSLVRQGSLEAWGTDKDSSDYPLSPIVPFSEPSIKIINKACFGAGQ
jgi:hypothetical protein